MKKFFIVVLYTVFIALPSRQQTRADSNVISTDSILQAAPVDSSTIAGTAYDSAAARITDSIATQEAERQKAEKLAWFQNVLSKHPFLPFTRPAVQSNIIIRQHDDNEAIFYFLIGLIFYFACIRLFFDKYLDNLLTLFFRVTMRHQQIREQLLQAPLPSLLLNILFVIASGFYLALLARYYNFDHFGDIWSTFLYAIAFVSSIYLGKYVVLKITGWVFNIGSATDTYTFIVFLVNKMIGIFLLPFIVLMSFPNEHVLPVLIQLSYIMLVLMLSYRFINSFRPIRSEIKVSRFHFFLYLCTFEIAPLLLIYKVLLAYVERSH